MDYDVTTYTCEDGAIAKILIPKTATEDDVKGIHELLRVVALRRFKIDLEEGE